MRKGRVANEIIRIQHVDGRKPSHLEREYTKTAIEAATRINPELPRYLESITFRKPMTDPASFRTINDDQRFVLRLIAVNAHYTFNYGPITPGRIEIDYTPHVDIFVSVLLHELAHVLDRADDPDRPNVNRDLGRKHMHHRANWSEHACALYMGFGCEKAALFLDGSNYKSTRARHARLIPHEAVWAKRVWTLMDQGLCGDLRAEFTELFIT